MEKLTQENINTQQYWNDVFENEIKNGIDRIALERFDKVTQLISNNMSMLDVGCGKGEFLNYLKEKKKDVILSGIDLSDIAIDFIKTRLEGTFKVGNINNISEYFTDKFDVIVCFETLEHLDDPVLFIREVRKVLKKDGFLIITTPYQNLVGSEEHLYTFDFKDFVTFFENSDWVILELSRYSEKFKNLFCSVKLLI
ncbi:MAG: class I SAM-dependent methyltransferase [bacterium]|nr:class I SAM-dependent methyltransferase [bacterium]